MINSSKENILKRITDAKQTREFESVFSVSTDAEIYKPIEPDTVNCFKNELENISGQCEIFETAEALFDFLRQMLIEKNIEKLFCREESLIKHLTKSKIACSNNQKDFELMKAAVTSCEYLISRTGSVVVSTASQSGRQLISFPPIHIVIATDNQLVDYPADAYNDLQKKYGSKLPSQITTITGPSRTADIEKTLVLGAHGPKEFIVLLCNDKSFNNFAI
ncbi:MAG: hypothetical protein H6Q18_260 [Bacteroidetes bacterium]|nr:hypothetical protein [Bacteroidota bacterium]